MRDMKKLDAETAEFDRVCFAVIVWSSRLVKQSVLFQFVLHQSPW